MSQPMTREQLTVLVNNACFAADTVAIENLHANMTGAEQTRAIVERTIEFLVGNGILALAPETPPEWMKIDPPYDPKFLEPKPE